MNENSDAKDDVDAVDPRIQLTQQQLDKLRKGLKTIWVLDGPTKPFRDDFIINKQLGNRGQFGVTYQCKRKEDDKTFAVKYVNKNRFYRIDPKFRERYLYAMKTEIEILNTLKSHPYIIKTEAIYEDKQTLYIVMEECKGGELFQRIVKKGRYEESECANIIKQILSALKFMHEVNQIVHCDLKPDNILFLTPDENSPIRIIDFGMSKVYEPLQYLTHLCGTPYYTAPEILDKQYNHLCDTWSVGVITYVMLFGYPPFYVDPERYSGERERRAIYRKIKKGFLAEVKNTEIDGYGPWFPDHIPISSDGREFISKLLEKKVRKRFSAQEALSHPWIINNSNLKLEDEKDNNNNNIKLAEEKEQNEQSNEEQDELKSQSQSSQNKIIPKELITSLAKFTNSCQFKLVVIRIFRQHFESFRPDHFKQLEEIFKNIDSNHDGLISFEEFKQSILLIPGINKVINENNIKSMYDELNVDNKQGINFEDLLNAIIHDYLVSCDERLYAAFRALDDDNDGKITTQELKNKLKEVDPLGEYDYALETIKKQALDDNGVIDYEQFLIALHPKFEEPPEWCSALYAIPSVKHYPFFNNNNNNNDDDSDDDSKKKSSKSKSKKSDKLKKKDTPKKNV